MHLKLKTFPGKMVYIPPDEWKEFKSLTHPHTNQTLADLIATYNHHKKLHIQAFSSKQTSLLYGPEIQEKLNIIFKS